MRCCYLFVALIAVSTASALDCDMISDSARSAISSGDGNACIELFRDADERSCLSPDLQYRLITTIRYSRGENAISAVINESNPEKLKQLCSQYLGFQKIDVPGYSWHQLNSTLFYFEKWQCQIHYLSDTTFADVH